MPLKINLQKSRDGKWVTFDVDAGIEFKIRPVTGEVLKELRKEAITATKMVPDPTSGHMVPVDKVDADKLDKLVVDYMIEDWKGLVDQDGETIALTPENKVIVYDLLPVKSFVWAAAQALDMENAQIKNLNGPLAGSTE